MNDDRQKDEQAEEMNPARQTDESEGKIRSEQVTKHNMERKDLARGSEPETRSSSHNRN